MPTWGDILKELEDTMKRDSGKPPFDQVRRKYIAELSIHTSRNTILFAAKWTSGEGIPPHLNSITDEDVQGLMEVVHGLKGERLDLIIHSPGGTLEAVEAVVKYLRTRFTHIRAIIPQAAMSAATMLS